MSGRLGNAFERFRIRWEERDPDDISRVVRQGLRRGLLAAAYAGASHALSSRQAGTIVMPTGSGKSAVMLLIAGLLRAQRVLVIVSSKALRRQLAAAFTKLDPFAKPELDLIDRPEEWPVAREIGSRPRSKADWEVFRDADVVVGLPQAISPGIEGVFAPPHGLFDLVLMDEAHHAASKTWGKLLEHFELVPKLMFTATPYRLDGRPLPEKQIFTYSAARAYEEGIFGEVAYIGVDIADRAAADEAIRDAAVSRLRDDRARGLDHRLLVKCKTIARAKQVAKIYQAAGVKVETIHSKLSDKTNQQRIQDMREGKLQGLVCAAMLGEGFDEPKLKVAAMHDQDRSLPITLQFIGRFARTTDPTIGQASFFSAPLVTQTDAYLRQLYRRDSVWSKLVPNFADVRTDEDAAHETMRAAFRDGEPYAAAPLSEDYWELLRPRERATIFDPKRARLDLNALRRGIEPGKLLYANEAEDGAGALALCVQAGPREPGWSSGGVLMLSSAVLYVAYYHHATSLLFFHCSAEGLERTRECLEAIGAGDAPKIPFEHISRIFVGETSIAPFNVGLRTRAHIHGAETYRSSLGHAAGDTFTSNDGLTYHRAHCAARVAEGEVLGASDGAKIWGGRNIPVTDFAQWCARLADRIRGGGSVEGRRGYFAIPMRKPIDQIERMIVAIDWAPIAYERDVRLVVGADDADADDLLADDGHNLEEIELRHQSFFLRDVLLKTERRDEPTRQTTIHLQIADVSAKIVYRPSAVPPFFRPPHVSAEQDPDRLIARFPNREESRLIDFLNEHPPALFSLKGAVMVGREGLPELTSLSVHEDSSIYEVWDWGPSNIKKERRNAEKTSVQDRAIEILAAENPDILFVDDGSGELADLVTIRREGPLDEERIIVSLYHCKASSEANPGARVDDYYEVAGQALKSARRLVFSDVRTHLRRRWEAHKSFEVGTIELAEDLLDGALNRVYKYEIVIVQPGFSAESLSAAAGEHLPHLIATTCAMIRRPGFAEFRVIGSR